MLHEHTYSPQNLVSSLDGCFTSFVISNKYFNHLDSLVVLCCKNCFALNLKKKKLKEKQSSLTRTFNILKLYKRKCIVPAEAAMTCFPQRIRCALSKSIAARLASNIMTISALARGTARMICRFDSL